MAVTLRQGVPTELLKVLDKLTKSATPKLRKALIEAFEKGRADFLDLLARVGPEQAAGVTQLWAGMLTSYATLYGPDGPLLSGMLAAGKGTAAVIDAQWSTIEANFGARASSWLESNGARLVTNVTDETRAAVNLIVQDSLTAPTSLAEAASKLVKLPALGLDTRQMSAFERQVVGLISRAEEEDWTSQTLQFALDQTYSGKLYARARRIAITEASNAGNAAVDFAIQESAASGEIDKEQVEVEWVTRVVNACPICEALDGERRSVEGGFFVSRPIKSGSYAGQKLSFERPTAHPHCYCGIRTVLKVG